MGDFYLGEIRAMPISYDFDKWLPCDGRSLQIASYQALYSLIGFAFGGDKVKTFNLPDMRGRVPIGQGTPTGSTNSYAVGAAGGTETVVLTQANMPQHTHTVEGDATNAVAGGGSENYLAKPIISVAKPTAENLYGTALPQVALNPGSVSTVGGGGGHDNVQPFSVLTYYISTQGVYPTRS